MSMVSISKVLEDYCGESDDHPESGDRYYSSACSIISGGANQNQISMGLFDETLRLTTESRQKSKLVQPIRPVQEITVNPIIPKSDVVKSKADGDSSLPANNSSSTVSVESNQFRYDENYIQESDPKGTFTMPVTKSSSHLALLTALGLITKPDPEDLVTIPGSAAKLQPSIKAIDSDKSNHSSSYASTGKTPVIAISSPSSVPKGTGHHKRRTPLRITVADAWSKVNTGMPYLTSPTSSPLYFDSTSGLGPKCSLPTPPCTPVESMGPYRTQDLQQSLVPRPSASRLPSGIPARRTPTPILSNQENKRETSSTTSSRLKANRTGIQALNPALAPPVPALAPTSSKPLPRPTKFTESGALTGSLGKGSQALSGPRIKVPTRATIIQSSPASVDSCSSRNSNPLNNTRQMIPARISSTDETSIRGTSDNVLVQSHLQSVLPTNITRPIAFDNPTLTPATGELNHAGHGSIRSRRAVGLKHEPVTSAKRYPSRTSNQENIPALTVTQPVSPNAIAPCSGINITGRRRGTRQEDAAKFVPDKISPTENHSRIHPGQATPASRSQVPLSSDLNRRKVRSTNVWI
ncbi:unnamed protein product [Rhizoctonia solani]|uniref:Uncharacterized protein n=1 Tax=Rhizoctonia solani TaxID=456999 RepID=A0A8H2XQ53_9AGAM|nr:unnamed protein product [Rhizoctonia solani]